MKIIKRYCVVKGGYISYCNQNTAKVNTHKKKISDIKHNSGSINFLIYPFPSPSEAVMCNKCIKCWGIKNIKADRFLSVPQKEGGVARPKAKGFRPGRRAAGGRLFAAGPRPQAEPKARPGQAQYAPAQRAAPPARPPLRAPFRAPAERPPLFWGTLKKGVPVPQSGTGTP